MTDELAQRHDIGAEQIVLGAMMTSREAITQAETMLRPDQFYRTPHATIFNTIVEMNTNGEPTDPVALLAHPDIARIGAPYLHTCYAAVPTAANISHYARIIAGNATLRDLARATARIQQLANTCGPNDADETVDRARELLAGIDANHPSDGPVAWRDVIPGLLAEIEQAGNLTDKPVGVATGLPDLDDILTGMQPGQLIVVAARPGVGKSVLLTGIAQHAAWRHKLTTAIFSLEMRTNELGMRLLASHNRLPLSMIKTGQLGDTEWTHISRCVGDTEDAPLFIDDTANITLADIRARARRLHQQQGGLALLVVDYLQLITTPRSENRQVAVAALSRGLKLLAKELGVPVLVAAQLNRMAEQRSDKRPHLSDLRESGGIEADADVVILIHRDDMYDPESPRAGEADLIVAKNRNGPMETITVAAQLHMSRFVSMVVA
jgi:replicative DNA helicase